MLKTKKAVGIAPELRITIRLAAPNILAEGIMKERKQWHGWKKMKSSQLIKEAKDRIANDGIIGREEFGREYGGLYDELCSRNLQDRVGLPIKKRKNKYDSKTTDELVEEALVKIARDGILDAREFSLKHRWLYNPLCRGGRKLHKNLSRMHNKILAYGIKYAKGHGIKDSWQLGAEYSVLCNVLHDWKLLPLMKYGKHQS